MDNVMKNVGDATKLDRFNGSNFTLWKETMKFFLITMKLFYILDVDLKPIPKPKEDETDVVKAERKKRVEDEALCRGYILNHLSDRLYDLYIPMKNPKEIWDSLETKYNSEKQGADKFITMQFFEFTMNDSSSILDQVHEFLILASKFKDLAITIPKNYFVGGVIAKLLASWNDYRKKLLHTSEDFTLEQIHKHLRTEEETQNHDKKSDGGSSSKVNYRDNIPRRRGISVEEFIRDFEEPNKPVLLEGCLDSWVAKDKWDKDYLIKSCGDVKFSVGPVEMKLEDYFRYSDLTREERPLYLFDPKFAEKVLTLGREYEVPIYFREDLFSVLGKERPDYRWIIIGPAGSGSSFHIDPNSTSAWNAVIKGSKKWVLFPPEIVPPGVHPSPDGAEVACPISIIEWFMNFYGATKDWRRRPIECVCKAGEVLFVPNGWWPLVINLEESIAITQNYVSRRNLLNVLEFLQKPNASELVSGTRDRVNLHNKFKEVIEVAFPGTIDQLVTKAEEKKKKRPFWETVSDSNAGAFKFSFLG
uniref:JmjC domain-containing protein n=1 Tax=Chenopodium quinoa TaxID=63459 RepID=A0A803NEX2_CHEQI